MTNKTEHNEKKVKHCKVNRLKHLVGIDLCACGGGHQLRCHGECRQHHTNPKSGRVECGELYQINDSNIKHDDSTRPRRAWRYGRQKEGDDKRRNKLQRQEKRERDQL